MQKKILIILALSFTLLFSTCEDTGGGDGGGEGAEGDTWGTLFFINASANGSGTTQYCSLNSAGMDPDESFLQHPVFRDGTITNFKLYVSAETLDDDVVVTIRKNGVDTALSITVSTATTYTNNDTVDFLSTDLISIEVDASAASSGNAFFTIGLEYE